MVPLTSSSSLHLCSALRRFLFLLLFSRAVQSVASIISPSSERSMTLILLVELKLLFNNKVDRKRSRINYSIYLFSRKKKSKLLTNGKNYQSSTELCFFFLGDSTFIFIMCVSKSKQKKSVCFFFCWISRRL